MGLLGDIVLRMGSISFVNCFRCKKKKCDMRSIANYSQGVLVGFGLHQFLQLFGSLFPPYSWMVLGGNVVIRSS